MRDKSFSTPFSWTNTSTTLVLLFISLQSLSSRLVIRGATELFRTLQEGKENLSLLTEFHDIGKIAILQSVLEKPGPFDEEWAIVKKYPKVRFRITQSIRELSSIANYILFHHECFDGTGYPRGLKGEDVPLFSRIIAICDAYDVVITGRPYRKARIKEEAIVDVEPKR